MEFYARDNDDLTYVRLPGEIDDERLVDLLEDAVRETDYEAERGTEDHAVFTASEDGFEKETEPLYEGIKATKSRSGLTKLRKWPHIVDLYVQMEGMVDGFYVGHSPVNYGEGFPEEREELIAHVAGYVAGYLEGMEGASSDDPLFEPLE